jgi:hypothetical protein
MMKTSIGFFLFLCIASLGILSSTLNFQNEESSVFHLESAEEQGEQVLLNEISVDCSIANLTTQHKDQNRHLIILADIEEKENEDKKYSPVFYPLLSLYFNGFSDLFISEIFESCFSQLIVVLPSTGGTSLYLFFEVFRI